MYFYNIGSILVFVFGWNIFMGYHLGNMILILFITFWYRYLIKEYIQYFIDIYNIIKMLHGHQITNEDTFIPSKDYKFAEIKYKRKGKWYSIYVPYDKKILGITKKVHAVYESDIENLDKKLDKEKNQYKIDITQQPGIPYLVTANNIGAKSIQISYGCRRRKKVDIFLGDDQILI